MKLTQAQLAEYADRGFLVFHDAFSAAEMDALRAELARVSRLEAPGINRENSGAIRSIYAVHNPELPTASALFEKYITMPRLLEPSRQLVQDDELYCFQTKCNLKPAFHGGIYQWHQDYGHWQNDGIPTPEMVTSLLMLDEATELSGCLYFIPGSHKLGVLKPELQVLTNTMKIWSLRDEDLVKVMQTCGEPVPISGKPGTHVFFHPNIFHASGHNLSRHPRWHIYTVYNRISNSQRPMPKPRAEWAVARKFTRVELTDDNLLGQQLVAAE